MRELLYYWWLYKQQTRDDADTINQFMEWLGDNIDWCEEKWEVISNTK